MDDRPELPGVPDESALDEWLAFGGPEEHHHAPIPHRRIDGLSAISLGLAVVTLVLMVLLRPTGDTREQVARLSSLGVPSQFHAAEVVDVTTAPCPGVPDTTCTDVGFELKAGPDVGARYEQSFPESSVAPTFSVGQTVILSYLAPNARVTDAASAPCDFDPEQECRVLTLALEEGGDGFTVIEHQLAPGDIGGGLTIGDRARVEILADDLTGELFVLSVSPPDPQTLYQYADYQRRSILVWLVLAFAIVVIALGAWRGAAALAGLAASVVILLLFVLPAILDGRSPVLVAVVGAAAIAYLALYLAHGFNRMTTVALLGTLAALTLTALLSALVVGAANFSGLSSEESSLLTLFEGIDVRGLLLAGIVLGSAGAIDDVTVTQASAVWELRAANPNLGQVELFRRGLRIGRDHIASTVNTLLLAYAGASLPLLVLFVLSAQSLGTVANSEVVAVEIVRTLVGSIGLVAAVPFTTWLASITAGSARGGGHAHA
jgi:uncharacterized membrane protein